MAVGGGRPKEGLGRAAASIEHTSTHAAGPALSTQPCGSTSAASKQLGAHSAASCLIGAVGGGRFGEGLVHTITSVEQADERAAGPALAAQLQISRASSKRERTVSPPVSSGLSVEAGSGKGWCTPLGTGAGPASGGPLGCGRPPFCGSDKPCTVPDCERKAASALTRHAVKQLLGGLWAVRAHRSAAPASPAHQTCGIWAIDAGLAAALLSSGYSHLKLRLW